MKLYRDRGIVLRTHKLGEADRIITILTRDHGKVRAVAKGVRRTSSRFGARLEPFSHVDLQLYEGKNLDIVTQVETIHPFGLTLARDYASYAGASAMVEMAGKIAWDEKVAEPGQFRLLLGALASMANAERHPDLTMSSYLLRSLSLAGFEVALRQCAVCGAPGPHRSFSVPAGGLVCDTCRPPGALAPSQAVIQLLDHLATGAWEGTVRVTDTERTQARNLVISFTQWHMERHLTSLAHLS